MESGMKVLVTGATGYTGQLLVKKLLAKGMDVRAIARKTSNISPFEGLDVTWFFGDVFDKKTVQQAMEGVSYVFHLAAAFRDAKSSEQDYRNVHLDSTQHIVNEALKNPVFMSLSEMLRLSFSLNISSVARAVFAFSIWC